MIVEVELENGIKVKAICLGYNPTLDKKIAIFRDPVNRDIAAIAYNTTYGIPPLRMSEDAEIRELTSLEQKYVDKLLTIAEL